MVSKTKTNVGYGLSNPLQNLSPLPILAKRAPLATDKAELSTIWIDTVANLAYILVDISSNVATWTAIGGGGGGSLEGDAGTAVTGAVINVVGGGDVSPTTLANSGLVFTGDGASTLSATLDYINLAPFTTGDFKGMIYFNNQVMLHDAPGTGAGNVFLGSFAGASARTNGISGNNIGIGGSALVSLSDVAAQGNTVIGGGAGVGLISGSQNTLIGNNTAQTFTTGGRNIAIGQGTASGWGTSESDNIYLGNSISVGVGESFTLRIGSGTGAGPGELQAAFINGIFGATTDVSGIPAVVDNVGKLGTVVSASRFKENIYSMGDYSSKIHSLRPVVFNYKGRKPSEKSVGLVAEEVQKVMPSLFVTDKEGKAMTVKYLDLIPMLLNEVQKLRKELDELKKGA